MLNADYERIKTIVGDIYEENFELMSSIPIDIFSLARKMGFRIIKASQRININHEKVLEFLNINSEKEIFGFSFFDRKKEEYVIYIDDINAKMNKQRFSLAHEIGHIALGHIELGVENEREAENQADYFASYLLCPECIGTNSEIYNAIYEDLTILTYLFGIAIDTASIKFRHICNRINLPNNKKYEYEKIIMRCLEEPILKKIRV